MTRDETIALFLQGREAWNAWAEGMLAERKALEEAGEWAAEMYIFGRLEGQNDKTKDWIARASVDFSRCRVVKAGADASSLRGADAPKQSSDKHGDDLDRHGADAPRDDDQSDGLITVEVRYGFDCTGFIFPANANFYSAQFHAEANFYSAQFHATAFFNSAQFHANAYFRSQFHARATFDRAEFHANAYFSSQFHAHATFDRAEFHATAFFNSAQFHANASFLIAQFHARASFDHAEFHATALFAGAQFHAPASFDRTQFHARASFDHAEFHGAVPSFNRVRFKGPAFFVDSAFAKGADFPSMHSEVGFDMSGAEFGRVPDFTQSTLHRDPRLDNVTIKRGSILGPGWRELPGEASHWKLLGIWTVRHRIDRDAPAKFRELKRFAIQGEDHRSELKFHAHEIRTARFVNDWFHHSRFWFGVGYELLSNFGRSVIRPAIAWGALVTVFAAIYLGISAEMNGRAPDYYALAPQGVTQPCLSVAPVADERVRAAQAQIAATTSASAEAWSLALKNGFVFIDWDRTEAARRTYGCLFGLTSDGGNTYPVVPRAVSVAGLIQNVLSAVLIFLLLLGIRNLLKLK